MMDEAEAIVAITRTATNTRFARALQPLRDVIAEGVRDGDVIAGEAAKLLARLWFSEPRGSWPPDVVHAAAAAHAFDVADACEIDSDVQRATLATKAAFSSDPRRWLIQHRVCDDCRAKAPHRHAHGSIARLLATMQRRLPSLPFAARDLVARKRRGDRRDGDDDDDEDDADRGNDDGDRDVLPSPPSLPSSSEVRPQPQLPVTPVTEVPLVEVPAASSPKVRPKSRASTNANRERDRDRERSRTSGPPSARPLPTTTTPRRRLKRRRMHGMTLPRLRPRSSDKEVKDTPTSSTTLMTEVEDDVHLATSTSTSASASTSTTPVVHSHDETETEDEKVPRNVGVETGLWSALRLLRPFESVDRPSSSSSPMPWPGTLEVMGEVRVREQGLPAWLMTDSAWLRRVALGMEMDTRGELPDFASAGWLLGTRAYARPGANPTYTRRFLPLTRELLATIPPCDREWQSHVYEMTGTFLSTKMTFPAALHQYQLLCERACERPRITPENVSADMSRRWITAHFQCTERSAGANVERAVSLSCLRQLVDRGVPSSKELYERALRDDEVACAAAELLVVMRTGGEGGLTRHSLPSVRDNAGAFDEEDEGKMVEFLARAPRRVFASVLRARDEVHGGGGCAHAPRVMASS